MIGSSVKFVKNEKGFTLVEVMISIFALTLLSGFILEMFLTASRVNQQAQDTDAGSIRAMSVIESFKQQDSPFDLERDPLLAGAFVDKSGQEMNLSLYYDAQWTPIPTSSASEASPEAPPGARFNMEVLVSARDAQPNRVSLAYQAGGSPRGNESAEGLVYSIQIQVYQLASDSGRTPLAELDSNHYFVY
ncbi:MAG: prepilin-type N-terminal cleavage/methylation domain-containing protein [Peptococcaceae bacterium]|jgi:prepilin-type N-terminal cleavage/methylation domain-containing protein|nr:prepilin-type N-terminal cleavage/methylation domain-containing protein [Peptococcaceae bacterium]